MNRRDFRRLGETRLRDAHALFAARRYDGAYYLAGYAVECGLKACIARLTRRYDFPPDRRQVDRVYTHELSKLVDAAGLRGKLEGEIQSNLAFGPNWATVKDWDETSRYSKSTKKEAADLISAISDPSSGVMPWIMNHW